MMAQDQGDLITKGSDYLTGGFVDFDGHNISLKDADEIYKVFLGELFAFVDGGEGNSRVKISSKSKKEILEEWHDKKMENAAECDVIHEVHKIVAGERVDADKSEMERDKEDYDPDYELFFNNLKPCGNAYVCELARKNRTVIAKYEDKDDEFYLPDEPRRRVTKSNPAGRNSPHTQRRNHSLRELNNLDIVHRNSSKYQGRDTKRSQRNTTRYDSKSHRPASRFADGPRWNGKRKAGDNEKNETPNHRRLSRRIFGELLVEDDEICDDLQEGKSQHDGCVASRNLPRRRGRPRKAESDKERVQTPSQRKMYKEYMAFLGGIKMFGEFPVYIDKDGNQYRYDECTDEGPLDLMNVEGSARPPSSSGRKTSEASNKKLKSSDKRVPSDGMNVEASAKPPPSSGRKGQEPSNKRLRSSDEKVPSDQMNGVGSAKPPSSSGRMTPEASNKRLKSSDKRVLSDPVNIEGSISEYRKRAMEILLKPYDRKDHIDLLKEAKLRRPVMHHREMRGRSTSFPDEVEVDKSYLDHYKELHKEIEAAQRDDPHKVLHLLRGLFFYLQCTCMEDSFVPWKDKSWLEAVHKSTSK